MRTLCAILFPRATPKVSSSAIAVFPGFTLPHFDLNDRTVPDVRRTVSLASPIL
jgi:hypothetical protein